MIIFIFVAIYWLSLTIINFYNGRTKLSLFLGLTGVLAFLLDFYIIDLGYYLIAYLAFLVFVEAIAFKLDHL